MITQPGWRKDVVLRKFVIEAHPIIQLLRRISQRCCAQLSPQTVAVATMSGLQSVSPASISCRRAELGASASGSRTNSSGRTERHDPTRVSLGHFSLLTRKKEGAMVDISLRLHVQ